MNPESIIHIQNLISVASYIEEKELKRIEKKLRKLDKKFNESITRKILHKEARSQNIDFNTEFRESTKVHLNKEIRDVSLDDD